MSYTHNWSHNGFTDEQWFIATTLAKRIIRKSSVPVRYELDVAKPPFVNEDVIRFNGVEDDGCETFYLTRSSGSEFCKTARRPYDEIVVAMLVMLVKINPDFSWSSDGDGRDFDEGLSLYNSINRRVVWKR